MWPALLIVLSTFLVGFLWFVLPWLLRKREEAGVVALCAENRAICLTFDDGPDPSLTPAILDFLAEQEIHASFFVLGKNAEKNPGLVARAVAAGHDVGHHSTQHPNAWKTSPWRYLKDITAGAERIEAAGGSSRLFRAPYGKLTLHSWLKVRRMCWKNCWWTVDPRDSLANPREHNQLLEQIVRDGGGVVLLHDANHYPCPNHADYVMSLLEKLVAQAREMNLRFLPISAVIEGFNSRAGCVEVGQLEVRKDI